MSAAIIILLGVIAVSLVVIAGAVVSISAQLATKKNHDEEDKP